MNLKDEYIHGGKDGVGLIRNIKSENGVISVERALVNTGSDSATIPWVIDGNKINIVNTFASKIGEITIRGGLTDNGSINLTMSENELLADAVGLKSFAFKDSIIASDIPALSASKITSGTFSADRIPNINLTSKVSGILPVANGGTGADTLTGLLFGNGTSAITASTPGANSTTPKFLTVTTDANSIITPSWNTFNTSENTVGNIAFTLENNVLSGRIHGWKNYTTSTPNSTSSDDTIPTSKAVYNAMLNAVSTVDAIVYKGVITGDTLPAANKGDLYKINKAGSLSGVTVEVGDMVICNTDETPANTPANWDFILANLDPTLYVTLLGKQTITGEKIFGSIETTSLKVTNTIDGNAATSSKVNGVIPEWSGDIAWADTDYIAAWNSDGTKIKALSKSAFATAGHTHSYLPLSGGTMTGAITMNTGTGLQMDITYSGNDPWIYLKNYPYYGIRYFEGNPDKMALSASGNNNSTSGADLCINGNGEGTVTIRGNTILHAGNYSSYALPLSGGTMALGEGLKFHSDNNYFGTDLDARIISLLDSNNTICDGGLIIDERATLHGTEYVKELLRIRHDEFKWKGNVIWHAGNDGSGSGLDADKLDGFHASCWNNKPWGTIPVINIDGFMDVGKHFEFHYDNDTGSDYSTLLGCTGNYANVVYLPSESGTLALTSQIPTSLPANGGNADTLIINSRTPEDSCVPSVERVGCYYANPCTAQTGDAFILAFNTANYIAQLAIDVDNKNKMAVRMRNPSNNWTSWASIITSDSIGSQSVNRATSADHAASADNSTSAYGLDLSATTITTGAAGWYKLAYYASTDPRGSVRIGLITIGGNFIPFYAELYVKNGWEVIDMILYGRFDYISKFRFTSDGTNCYIEGYFPTANTKITLQKIKGVSYVSDYTSGWNLYSTATPGSGTVQDSENTRSSLSSGLYTNRNIEGNGFVKSDSSDNYVLLGGGGHKAVSDFATAGHTHSYLPLSGGTVTGPTIFNNANTTNTALKIRRWGDVETQQAAHYVDDSVYYIDYTNDDSFSSIHFRLINTDTVSGGGTNANTSIVTITGNKAGSTIYANSFVGMLTGNADTATKLQTARTIWGQSFDGTGNVDGDIVIHGAIVGKNNSNSYESYIGNASGGINDGEGALMYAYGSRNLYFYTGSTQRMIINSSGSVGIGTTSPSYKLHVNGSALVNSYVYYNSSKYYSGYYSNGKYLELFNLVGQVGIHLFDNGTIKMYRNGVKYDNIDSGNINSQSVSYAGYADSAGSASSAGYSDYTQKLQVNDVKNAIRTPNYFDEKRVTAWFNNSGTPTTSFYSGIHVKGWNNGRASWELCSYCSTGTDNNYNLYFRNGNNDSWGNWKTILDSSNYNAYSPTLTGTGASGTWGINISGKATYAGTSDFVVVYGHNVNTYYSLLFHFGDAIYDSTGVSVTVNPSTGNINAGNFSSNSDIRYKTVIKHIDNASSILSTLPIFLYKWNNREDLSMHVGSSALDVMKIFPELVTYDTERDFYNLDYATLGTVAGISACKEIEKLKLKILELEFEIKLLKYGKA